MIDIEKARHAYKSLIVPCLKKNGVFLTETKEYKAVLDAIDELERLQKTDTTLEIVKEIRADLAKMYAVVCETDPQKAIARTVDNVLEEIIQEMECRL
jgi:hypothetical protein